MRVFMRRSRLFLTGVSGGQTHVRRSGSHALVLSEPREIDSLAKGDVRCRFGETSGCAAPVPLRPRRIDQLAVPVAPARRLGGRGATAHGVAHFVRDDEPALPCTRFEKSNPVLRRRLRDPVMSHRSKLKVRQRHKGPKATPAERQAASAGCRSDPWLSRSSVSSRPAYLPNGCRQAS